MSKLYTEKEVAEMLKLSVYTLREWRARTGTKSIKYLKIGGAIRYEEREILKFLERCRQG